jgi:hypothetical protein
VLLFLWCSACAAEKLRIKKEGFQLVESKRDDDDDDVVVVVVVVGKERLFSATFVFEGL